ncbi:hypothetical protein [Beggiatoa leptomitoformis]|uniref:Uncharacterized protein n=1 Tax=Beggiatoa leptomitoformis TaxID=288004 RepID=A0A2N9YIM3_9GAMM|nr:hypothetical protein [Beggiatoa leptomitoformis]ALG67430.1 hypothetical protein AL038_06595 [Beggiatoa leptomitoformis]AUI70354.1 hypothetical protein BLE401_17710 [Beggiatoa leptomitoformis]
MKWVYNSILACFITLPVLAADNLYLEGVSILGSKKNAYISFNGGQVTVNEGDALGTWTVTKIDSRAVSLSATNGEVKELPLHTQMSIETPTATPTPAQNPPVNPNLTVIPDDKVPAGHRKIRTPFGDVIVKDEPLDKLPKPQDTSQPAQNTVPPVPRSNEPVPEGHHKVATPFGEFVVKDEEKSGQ